MKDTISDAKLSQSSRFDSLSHSSTATDQATTYPPLFMPIPPLFMPMPPPIDEEL